MENNLNATTSGGTQTTTQSPQSVAAGGLNNNISTNSIQSVNSTNYLNSSHSGGLQLTPTALSTVNLSNLSSSSVANPSPSAVSSSKHHINAGLLAVAVILFLFAVVLFWMTSRTANTTTE